MSYAVPAPVAVTPRRPATVALAAAVLATMAVIGLGYAVVTLVVVPGVVEKFRAGAGGVATQDVDGVALLVWVGAGFATVLAVLLFALYSVLAVGLRRGSNAARVTTWAVCGLGLLAGCGSVLTVVAQRKSTDSFGGLATPLSNAYPSGWLGTNVALAVAQMVGYAVVAGLLVAAPGHFFGRDGAPAAPPTAPGPYGAYGALPGMPGLYDTPAPPAPSPYGGPYGPPPPASYPGGSPAPHPGGSQAPYPPAGPLPPSPGTPLAPGVSFGAGGPPPGESGDDQYWARPPS